MLNFGGEGSDKVAVLALRQQPLLAGIVKRMEFHVVSACDGGMVSVSVSVLVSVVEEMCVVWEMVVKKENMQIFTATNLVRF